MRRRTFLVTGASAVLALAGWRLIEADDEDAIVMVVRKRLDYLQLDLEGLKRFAHDQAALHTISKSRLLLISGMKPVYTRFALSAGRNKLSNLLRHGEERVVANFLISSDFFLNGADETRVVKYLGMLDPARACANPFYRPPV